MSMYPHRGGMAALPSAAVARLTELLDQVRSEFDGQVRTIEGLEHQSMVPKIRLLDLTETHSPF